MSTWVERTYLVVCDECSYEEAVGSSTRADEMAAEHLAEHEESIS